MTRKALLICTTLLVALAPPAGAVDVEETNQFLIELNGSGPADFAAAVAAAGGTASWVDEAFGYGAAVSDDPKFAKKLKKINGIKKVHADLMVQWTPSAEEMAVDQLGDVEGAGHGPDPTATFFFPCQWNMTQIDAPGAWAKDHFGHPGVKVAVLDSGVDATHFELAGKVDLANSASMLSTPSACDLFADDVGTFNDYRFHGTAVASHIAGNSFGMASVAPLSTIVAVKVLNCLGSGSFGDVINGIVYAANLPDVDVINMSLGAYFPKNSPGGGPLVAALNKAVNYAGSQGKLVVSASGNDGADLQHDGNFTSVPAESGSGISVYATNVNDQLASYSNHGVNATWVGAGGGDSVAPSPPLAGCPISPASQGSQLGACTTTSLVLPFICGPADYLLASGTSFASPMVAGVAALVDGKHGGALNSGQLKTILKNTADDLGAPGADNLFSHGRVNASNAVDQ